MGIRPPRLRAKGASGSHERKVAEIFRLHSPRAYAGMVTLRPVHSKRSTRR